MSKIVTLTLGPALDKSTTVERLIPEQKLRCAPMQIDAGGGGINVSKGIRKLGGQSIAVFPVGGHNGRQLQDLLTAAGIESKVVQVAGETRENMSVTETSTNIQYRFTLPAQTLSESDAEACLQTALGLGPDILVASGSLPPGLPDTWYAHVAQSARARGVKLIVDTSGPALQAVASEGLFLLKPNLGELCALVGVKDLEMNQIDDAALELINKGQCEVVVVSLGPQGALLVTKDGFEHIPAPIVQKRSTVGAGDSMVAGMTFALSQNKPYREVVQRGVACGSAATMNTGTRLFNPEDAERLYQWIVEYGDRYRFTDF